MKRRILLAASLLMLAVAPQWAEAKAAAHPAIPAAIFTDPPADKANPPRMEVLHIPSGGVEINGVAYLAGGAGPHPTVVLLHGLPGNEKNLDLAQAIRRAGWNCVTFNYRGSWGSPGTYSFRGNLADAKAVLAYVRAPANAAKLQVDTGKLVIAGHSMGGWVTAMTAGGDPGLAGAVMISAADMGRLAAAPPAARLSMARDNMETLAGVTPESMAQEMATFRDTGFAQAAPGLARMPLLVLTSDDGLAPMSDALVADLKKRGDVRVTAIHQATDHSWSGKRIALEAAVVNWLQALK
ncbi:MAG TPA: alpha/beta fold hydrolase [Phenylobacterium sp.]|jgi:pimeloyl-ACP methyl ester carboxylesterase|uniref:alpha/beta hydrolase family protein n=1 Tax=Phenylobacterium sp. TaxID=1871053 RepID=UPI002C3C8144|nr:alpha/beta fold hydrolase [Phenylobacterium sp.]HXA38790.1 alpha/beta fold hydrolase [Phenylobacterium sp.]